MGEEDDPGTSVLNQGQRAGREGLAGQSNRAEPPRDPALPRPAPRGVWWEEEAQVTSSPGGPATRSLVAQEPAVLPRTTTPAPAVSAPPAVRPPPLHGLHGRPESGLPGWQRPRDPLGTTLGRGV